MSKINVCKICVNKDICIVKEDCIYWQTSNQAPQLSDDVEHSFDYIIRVCKTSNVAERHYIDAINTIKNLIQAQASEIERLKKEVKQVTKIGNVGINFYRKQINAIREVGVMSGLDSLTRSGAILILKAIKQILKEETK